PHKFDPPGMAHISRPPLSSPVSIEDRSGTSATDNTFPGGCVATIDALGSIKSQTFAVRSSAPEAKKRPSIAKLPDQTGPTCAFVFQTISGGADHPVPRASIQASPARPPPNRKIANRPIAGDLSMRSVLQQNNKLLRKNSLY